MGTKIAAPADYDAEVRFGVVMYGGVSLAIYIYGVSRELFELACATPLPGREVDLPDLEGTREIYRRLARLTSDPDLVRRYAALLQARAASAAPPDLWDAAWDDGPRTRFVVDVIAGTSAGGINGIYLAKALALAQPFSVLRDLWVDDGDLGKLLNDGQAADALPGGLPAQPDGPKSLLSSDRMYRKLLQALEDMHKSAGTVDASPLVETLDLYVTTTDIAGAPVALRLFDKVVYERRHKQRFHFSYPTRVAGAGADAQDFDAGNHAFLAYAARCTSSFPFAFEPMTLSRLGKLVPDIGKARLDTWRPYFNAFAPAALARDDWADRPFGDGGYLDNKPFSYVVEALSQRFGDAPAQRKLIYVEPDPEVLDPARSADAPVPNAVGNAMAALTSIPQYETIREDLLAVLQRNRRIERVERLLRLSEEDVERAAQGFSRVRCIDGKVPEWSTLSLDAMVRYYGSGFRSYRRLRVYAVTDWLAAQVAAAFGIDAESDRGYALRAVVRAWREGAFTDNPKPDDGRRSVNAFLNEYDFDYRLRRLAFVIRRVDHLTRLVHDANNRPDRRQRSDLEDLIAKKLRRIFGDRDPLTSPPRAQRLLAELRRLKKDLRLNYGQLLAIRGRWARGVAVAGAVAVDETLRSELNEVLALLIGQTGAAGAAARTLRTEGGGKAAMPAASGWLQTTSSAHGLQDSVFERVQAWLDGARKGGQQPLLLWLALLQALQVTRISGDKLVAADVKALLDKQWDLLGRPQLEARKLTAPDTVDGEERWYRAELVVDAANPGDPDLIGQGLRMLLGEYYLSFDAFDQTRFTLYYDTATGEPAVVDVVRVSPTDAPSLRKDPSRDSKLAGTSLGHFGAFLEEDWRRNDIMWGRLDGVDRLVRTVLPADDEATGRVRDELVRIAQGRILECTLKTAAAQRLTKTLVKELEPARGRAEVRDNLRQRLTALKLRASPARQQLAGTLQALLSPDALRSFVRNESTFDPKPAVDRTLKNAARAVTITGQILDGVSQANAKTVAPLARWMARLGLVLQGAVAVAVPGGLTGPVFRRLLLFAYLFEVFLFGLSFFLGDPNLRTSAIGAFLATAAAQLATTLLGDYMRGRRILKQVFAVVGALLIGLAVVGGVALKQRGLDALVKPATSQGGPV